MRTIKVLAGFTALALYTVFTAGVGQCQNEPTTGTSSQQTSITLQVDSFVALNDLTANIINNTTWDGSADVTGSDTVCVYANIASKHYMIVGKGSGAASAYTIAGTAEPANTIAYSVTWNDGGGAVALTAAAAAAQKDNAKNTLGCTGGNNATLAVTIAKADALAVPADTYTGTLTIEITPSLS